MTQLVVQHKTQTTEYRHIIGLQHTITRPCISLSTLNSTRVYMDYISILKVWVHDPSQHSECRMNEIDSCV